MADGAAKKNRLDTIQWIYTEYRVLPRSELLSGASIAILDWVKATEPAVIDEQLAQFANAATLAWLSDNDYDRLFTDEVKRAQIAATFRYDYSKMVWIYEHWNKALPDSLDWTAEIGDLKSLKWALERTTLTPSPFSLVKAAGLGHFKLLKWVHKKHPNLLSQDVVYNAIDSGQLEIARYFSTRLDPITKDNIDLSDVCGAGNLAMLQWIFEHYKHLPSYDEISSSIDRGHHSIVEWILGMKDPIFFKVQSTHIVAAIAHGNHLLYQLLNHHMTKEHIPSIFDLELAFAKGHGTMFKILLEQYTGGPPDFDIKVNSINYHILKWLIDTGRLRFQDYFT